MSKSIISAVILALLLQAGPANVAGEWFASLTLPLGDTNFTMFIVQKGADLTGYMLNESGQFDLKGSVNRDQVRFEWDYPDRGQTLTIAFNGKLERNSISGVARVGEVVQGTMSAQRK